MEAAIKACRAIELVRIPARVDKWHGRAIFERVNRLISKTTRLTGVEALTANTALGPQAIEYDDVRVAEGGLVEFILSKFLRNSAVTLFHTINFPIKNGCTRKDLGTVIHELTHVFQYEHVGSIYITQCLTAQNRDDYNCYEKVTPEWLRQKKKAGKTSFRDFDREQQACIMEGYFNSVIKLNLPDGDPDRQIFEEYANQLRTGNI